MSMGGWNLKVAAASGLLLLGGCDLSQLVNDKLAEFEKLVPKYGVDSVETTIDENGGKALTEHGGLSVPEGALEDEVTISIAETSSSALMAPLPSVMHPVTPPMAFTPHGTQFLKPVQLSLFFDQSRATSDMFVLRLDNEHDTEWEVVDAQIQNGAANLYTTHFSIYGVVRCSSADPALNDLCDALKRGEATLTDLVEMAPSDGGWNYDDGDARPGTDGPGDSEPYDGEPGPGGEPGVDDCQERTDACKSALSACIASFEAEGVAECDATACEELLASCPVDPREFCPMFATLCGLEVAGSCQTHELVCTTEGSPNCPDLAVRCARDDQQACDELRDYCGAGQACDVTAAQCANGDQAACDEWARFCSESEPGPEPQCGLQPTYCDAVACECDLLGNSEACAEFEASCGDEASEPPDTGSDDLCAELSGCEALACDCHVYDVNCDLYSDECSGNDVP